MLYDLDDETGNKYDDYWVLKDEIPGYDNVW
jgi:hypothetical protein